MSRFSPVNNGPFSVIIDFSAEGEINIKLSSWHRLFYVVIFHRFHYVIISPNFTKVSNDREKLSNICHTLVTVGILTIQTVTGCYLVHVQ